MSRKQEFMYTWLFDSLMSIKIYKYFRVISQPDNKGYMLISLYKRNKIIINILRTSKRCYKVCYSYFNISVPILSQEFISFADVSSLIAWLNDSVLIKHFKNVKPLQRLSYKKNN